MAFADPSDLCYTCPATAVAFGAFVERALPLFVQPPVRIWSPAAGGGALSAVAEATGLPCRFSDLQPVAAGIETLDFYECLTREPPGTLMVENPPYGQRDAGWQRFVGHGRALDICHFVLILPASLRASGSAGRRWFASQNMVVVADEPYDGDAKPVFREGKRLQVRLCFVALEFITGHFVPSSAALAAADPTVLVRHGKAGSPALPGEVRLIADGSCAGWPLRGETEFIGVRFMGDVDMAGVLRELKALPSSVITPGDPDLRALWWPHTHGTRITRPGLTVEMAREALSALAARHPVDMKGRAAHAAHG